jgi:hypothetical protein
MSEFTDGKGECHERGDEERKPLEEPEVRKVDQRQSRSLGISGVYLRLQSFCRRY